MTVYNKDRPTEKYWLVLRLSFGRITNFQMPPSSKTSHAYDTLESQIVRFLKSVAINSEYFVRIASGASLGPDGPGRRNREVKERVLNVCSLDATETER
jgi:hypothetical protein